MHMQNIKPSTSSVNVSGRFNTIKSLNLQKLNWRIKAKVTESTGAKKSAKDNPYIKVTLEDISGKINAFAWGKDVAKFAPLLIKDQTVKVFGAKLEKCNSDRGFIKHHKCKILLRPITDIVPCNPSFTTFAALQKTPDGTFTNCIGTIIHIGDIESKKSTKTDDQYFPFRKLILEDKKKNRIDLDLWNKHAKSFCGKLHDVLAVKDLKVKIYEGNHQFSTISRSKLDLNPNCNGARVLRQRNNNNAVTVPDTAGPVKRKRKTPTKATGTPKLEKKKRKTDGAKDLPEWLEGVIKSDKCNHVLKDKQATHFSDALGFNWELLGGWLDIHHTKIEQIKLDNKATTEMQVYKLLIEWRKRVNEKATLQALLVVLKDCPNVHICWDKIKEKIIDPLCIWVNSK